MGFFEKPPTLDEKQPLYKSGVLQLSFLASTCTPDILGDECKFKSRRLVRFCHTTELYPFLSYNILQCNNMQDNFMTETDISLRYPILSYNLHPHVLLLYDKSGHMRCCMTKSDKYMDSLKILYDKNGYLLFRSKTVINQLIHGYEHVPEHKTIPTV